MATTSTQSSPLDKIIRSLRYRHILPHIPPDAHDILDVGCGPRPWFLGCSAIRGTNVAAIDSVLYDFSKNDSPKFSFVVHNAENPLPFADSSFDLVTMFATLEHLNRPFDVLREVRRVLRQGGTLLCTVPTNSAKPVLEFLAYRLHLIDEFSIRDHKRYYTEEALRTAIQEAGLLVEKSEYFEFGFNLFVKARKQ